MIEFAIAFPVFILMMIGVVEIAILMFVQVTVEGGLREASRYGITGQQPTGGISREQEIVNIVKKHAQGLVEIDASDVEMLTYQDFSSIGQPEPYDDADDLDGPAFKPENDDVFTPALHDRNGNNQWDADQGNNSQGAGGSGQVVLYRVTFDWDWLTPLPGMFEALTQAKSTIPETISMEASIAVRNEPWPTAGTP